MKALMFRANTATNEVKPTFSSNDVDTSWLCAIRRTEAEAWKWLIAKHNDAYRDFTAQAQDALLKREEAMRGLAQAEKAVTK